jgi:hypothetical protein
MANTDYISWHTSKWMKKIVFSSIRTTKFFIPRGGFHIEIFNLPSLGIHWYMLDENGDYQGE